MHAYGSHAEWVEKGQERKNRRFQNNASSRRAAWHGYEKLVWIGWCVLYTSSNKLSIQTFWAFFGNIFFLIQNWKFVCTLFSKGYHNYSDPSEYWYFHGNNWDCYVSWTIICANLDTFNMFSWWFIYLFKICIRVGFDKFFKKSFLFTMVPTLQNALVQFVFNNL